MKKAKATGPDNIPSEVWQQLGDVGYEFLAILFNKILRNDPMPESFRKSFLLPFFKNKGDTRKCGNYRGIKLMSHTMKIFERIMDTRLRNLIQLYIPISVVSLEVSRLLMLFNLFEFSLKNTRMPSKIYM